MNEAVAGQEPPARRVFLSHTSELRRFPTARSFVRAAESAVARAGDAVMDMAYSTAQSAEPATACRAAVARADVYVVIVGFRYGSPVRGRPDVSHTELEHEAAEELDIPRLVFLISNEAEGPASMFLDAEYGTRQRDFRERLSASGVTTTTVTSPADLETRLLQALVELPRPPAARPTAAADDRLGRRAWTIPARTAQFTGREHLLDTLTDTLRKEGRAVVAAVTGLGGVGKTTTAVEYAHRHADSFDIAWWIPAEDPTLVPGRLAELAYALELADPATPAPVAVPRLFGELADRGRWLLVFDNADKPAALTELIPAGPGQVMVTSRNPDWSHLATPVEVAVFDRTESVTLLRRLNPRLGAEQAEQVAAALGDLPLALAQAGAVLAEGMPPAQYLSLLATSTSEVLAAGRLLFYPRSLAAAVRIALDQAGATAPATLPLLQLCARLAPEPIPTRWFTSRHVLDEGVLPEPLASVARNPIAFRELVGVVRTYGLATLDPDRDELTVHRLTQAIVRDDTPSGDQPTLAVALATALAFALDPVSRDRFDDPANWSAWAALVPHLRTLDLAGSDDPLLARIACAASDYLMCRGDYHAAQDLAADLHRAWEARLGAGHPTTLMAAGSLANALQFLRRHTEARTLQQQIYDHERTTRGADHPGTLMAAHNLAGTLSYMGEYGQARTLDMDTLRRRRRILGDDHRDTLASIASLANDVRAQGHHRWARTLDEEALIRRRSIHGDDHPDSLGSANNLANTLHELREYEQARELHEDTLARRRRVLGDDHPDTRVSAQNLASSLRVLGEYEQARVLDEDTLARRRRVLGDDHPDTLASAHNLATDLRRGGDCQQARTLDEDTLARCRRILGDDHPDTLASANNLANTLHELGKYEQARALNEDTLARRRRVLGDDHPDTRISAHNLAANREALGEN